METINLLRINQMPIKEQLLLEEALLRADSSNWCLINTGVPEAIVMGISGKPSQLLNLELVKQDQVPLIKRFSGGGTVYVDPHTVFVTFICNSDTFVQSRAIMEWSETIYKPFFAPLPFQLIENDYVLEGRKFGGNAQYIQRGRWLHHTSFLWDYDMEKMDYLLLPERRPKYRQSRRHKDFLLPLRSYFPQKEAFIERLSQHFQTTLDVKEALLDDVQHILERPHRKSTINVSLES
ncbi:MAG: lipoate--protein ligase family protein [Chlamydiales bacterium]